VSEEAAPERIAVVWSPEAWADLRAMERATAMQILHCVDRYLANRTGHVKKLKPPLAGFRLRCGDYRVFFDQKEEHTIHVTVLRFQRRDHNRGHRCSQPPRGLPLSCGIHPGVATQTAEENIDKHFLAAIAPLGDAMRRPHRRHALRSRHGNNSVSRMAGNSHKTRKRLVRPAVPDRQGEAAEEEMAAGEGHGELQA
jgi:mRNA-degrading endonuclease RelE of RelBE toxin-antitoxin system